VSNGGSDWTASALYVSYATLSANKKIRGMNGEYPEGDVWLRVLLALRLNQLANEYEEYSDFVTKAGLSRATLYQLRKGQGNVTIDTLGRLADNLGVSIWSLFGRTETGMKRDLESFGFSFKEVEEFVENDRRFKKDYSDFKGVRKTV